MLYKHEKWEEFGKSISRCNIHNVYKNQEFLTTMFCDSFVNIQLDYLEQKYSEDEINRLVWEPIETMGEGNNIHQLYHLTQYLEYNPGRFDSIVEFGAGYGSLCVRAFRLNLFREYNIIDIPELQGLQREYLQENEVTNVNWYSSIDEFLNTGKQADLFIALWSLSEAPKPCRIQAHKLNFKNYFFAYGDSFFNLQNKDYFYQFLDCRPEIAWKLSQTQFKSDQYYLMGK